MSAPDAERAEHVTPPDATPDDATPDEPAEPAVAASQHRGGWSTLRGLLRPRATRSQILIALLCALLGFAVVAQLRQTRDDGLTNLRQSELVGILDQTTRQGDDLQREIAELERTRAELESGTDSRQAALDAATRSAAVQGILTGRLPAEGPGIIVTLTQATGTIRYEHMLNMLEELRNAGAEAVQVNDQRLTASSYFAPADDGVVVDGVLIRAPYVWRVIGNPETMSTALDMHGGALAVIRNGGGKAAVTSEALVEVTATREPTAPQYATPQPAPTG
ncbi:DUF881 domain-containing protein [Cellulomonas timonensis]|uniref:DUF881 domain-containing protein n=1 Tax=Cellulomonas timonensis TaxID=1689271 RepID=UPI0008332D91|nr:DUF881 domain-containing protein [Cellulomonas timonensis]